jgi:HAD superfamily hydrolase (TIGR01509 family)
VKFDAIIFDFDGVIVDSEPGANQILAEQLTAIGLPMTPEESLARYCGHRWSDCVTMIETQLGRPVPVSFVEELIVRGKAKFLETAPVIAGVGAFVEAQSHRARAIASSNEADWLSHCLDRIGLAHHFGPHVYSAAALERGKPHPDVYLMVADELGVDPDRALVVEDSATGVASGVAAGMQVVGLLAGGHITDQHDAELRDAGAHHLVTDYPALERLIVALES